MPRYAQSATSVGTFAVDITPVSADGAALGTIALPWSDLRLASGAVIDFNNDLTLTHSANAITLAGGQLVVTGAASAPAITDTAGTGAGFWGVGGGEFGYRGTLNFYQSNGTTAIARIGSGDTHYIEIAQGRLYLSDGSYGTEVVLFNESAGVLQQGLDAASAVAQTFKGADARAGTDTNTVGGVMRLASGRSTGNAVPGVLSLQGTAATVTSGTGAQTLIDRFIPNAFRVLTDGSPIAVLNVTIANNTMTGGKIVYCIEVTDGTDYQSEIGEVFFCTQNDGAAVVGTIAEVNSQQAISAGGSTLATTWAMTDANPAVISVNANSSLTPSTGYPRITFSVQNFGQQAVAIQ